MSIRSRTSELSVGQFLITVIILLLFTCVSHIVSTETYYVIPTAANTSVCPEDSHSLCMTLSQYANTSIGYFASNTTLILLPGNHSLDLNLTITNITSVSIRGIDYGDTSISCSQQEVRLTLQDITDVHVRGIVFLGCVSTVSSVGQFLLDECKLQGTIFGSKLELIFVHFSRIFNSHFTTNTLVNRKDLLGTGSVFAQGCTTVSIESSSFSDNYANLGSCIYTVSSHLIVYDSNFTNNIATVQGGAIEVVQESTIVITSSVFIGNSIKPTVAGVQSGNMNTTNSRFFMNAGSTEQNNPPTGGGAVSAINSSVLISDCVFGNNSATTGRGGGIALRVSKIVVERSEFVGNTGNMTAGAIACAENSNCKIIECTFENNVAMFGGGGAIVCENCFNTVSSSTFHGNTALNNIGGAISVVCAVFGDCGGSITDTVFGENVAMSAGALSLANANFTIKGGVHFDSNRQRESLRGIFGLSNSQVLITGNTTFSNNIGLTCLAFNSNVTFAGDLQVYNNFVNVTRVHRGGTLTFYQSEVHFVGNSTISSNTAIDGGAIFSLQSTLYLAGDMNIQKNVVSYSGGGIYAYQSVVNFMPDINRTIKIAENQAENGGGIFAFGATVNVYSGPLLISENTAEKGGGLYLESFAKLYIRKQMPECQEIPEDDDTLMMICQNDSTQWIRLIFSKNSAIIGGAIFVDDETTSDVCSSVPNTSLLESITGECFFQALYIYDIFQFSNRLPRIVENQQFNYQNVYFENNSAEMAGDSLFGGLLDRCRVNPSAEILLNDPETLYVDATAYISATTNVELPQISSYPVRVCFCKDNRPDCGYQPPIMRVRKGESFTMTLVAVDHVNQTIPSTIRSSASSNASVSRGQSVQNTSMDCSTLSYNVNSPRGTETISISLYAEGPCQGKSISEASFEIQLLECPVGFVESENGRCDCDPVITDYVRSCSIDTQSITKVENTWIYYDNSTQHGEYLVSPNCPFDYCTNSEDVLLNLNFPDVQCNFNRSGIMCGQCIDGLSLSFGGSQCKKCTNNWLALLVVFALAGIALVAFVLFFNLTVAVGTTNGLIFYANIVAVKRAAFFPPNIKRNIVTVFISWVNLDFGFESCFYDGMDDYARTWLQLLFPTYIIILVLVVILTSEYSQRFARIISKHNPVATLETLLLLSYTKFLRLIIAGLSVSRIERFGTSQERDVIYVWRVDGNLEYLGRRHIPLFIVTFIIAIVCFLFIFVILFWQCLQRCRSKLFLKLLSNPKINSFVDAYHAPFKSRHRYWPGFLLITRGFLYVIITVVNVNDDPAVNIWTITVTTGILLTLSNLTGGGIYKKWPLNTLENLYLLNLLILSTSMMFVLKINKDKLAELTYTSIGVAFVTFLAVLLYHLYAYVLLNFTCFQNVVKKIQERSRKKHVDSRVNSIKEQFLTRETNPRTKHKFSDLRGHLNSILQVSDPGTNTVVYVPQQTVTEERDIQIVREVHVVTHSSINGVPYCEEESVA